MSLPEGKLSIQLVCPNIHNDDWLHPSLLDDWLISPQIKSNKLCIPLVAWTIKIPQHSQLWIERGPQWQASVMLQSKKIWSLVRICGAWKIEIGLAKLLDVGISQWCIYNTCGRYTVIVYNILTIYIIIHIHLSYIYIWLIPYRMIGWFGYYVFLWNTSHAIGPKVNDVLSAPDQGQNQAIT